MTRNFSNMDGIESNDIIPSLQFTMDLKSMVKYAAATWDFHRYHYDAEFVKSIRMPAPFVDGQMFGALIARALMSWAGPDAFLRRLSYRQSATVYVDETIVVTGRVRSRTVEGGVPIVLAVMSIAKTDGTSVIRDAAAKIQLASSSMAADLGAHQLAEVK